MASYDVSQLIIKKTEPEVELVDVMGNCSRWQVDVDQNGFVALVDCMPRLIPKGKTGDSAIVQAARVSYGSGTKHVNQDRGLIRYLSRHRHSTPFEMVEFKFHCAMPLFVARQWIRHRTANVNEYSARYSVVPDRFFRPTSDAVRQQSTVNRQGSDKELADNMTAAEFLEYLDKAEAQYDHYTKLLEKGVTREQARIGLPLTTYTEWYWKCDLHNIFHFLSLRMDSHAQQEIQDYARAMFALIKDIVPYAAEAFVDYRLEGMFLTRLEVEAIREGKQDIDTSNKREANEWKEKRALLGIK